MNEYPQKIKTKCLLYVMKTLFFNIETKNLIPQQWKIDILMYITFYFLKMIIQTSQHNFEILNIISR